MRQRGLVFVLVMVCLGATGFGFSGGSGTAGDPYEIATAADLVQVASYPTAHFILTNDIDLQGASFANKVAASTFAGTFNGNGFSILNYSVTTAGGFFTAINGTVRNLSLINGVYTSASSCGGLTYQTGAGAVVENCYVDCTITSTNTHLGGLVAINWGTIRQCGTHAVITEAKTDSVFSNAGCLVGQNRGTITDCYATGVIDGQSYVGGFAGFNNSVIERCYCSANIVTTSGYSYLYGFVGENNTGTLIDCFWDVDAAAPLTIGANPDTGLTGLDTAGMQTQGSFVNWDFVGDGGDDIWAMPAGEMPILNWQANGRYCITPSMFDANGDCLVNLVDFAAFAQEWLACGYANQGLCP